MKPANVLTFSLAVLVSLLVTWGVQQRAYDWATADLRLEGEERLLKVISSLRNGIDSYKYLPFLISQNSDVQALLARPEPDRASAVSRFLEQINLVSGATALMVLDLDGRALSYSRWREERAFFMRSHADAPYFRHARQGDQRVYVDSDDSGEGAIYLSAPIYAESRFIGVAAVRIDLGQLQERLAQHEHFLLASRNGDVILASNEVWRSQPLRELMRSEAMAGAGGIQQPETLRDGQRVIFQTVDLPDLGWRVAVYSPMLPAVRIRNTVALISLGGCFALGLMLLYLRERHLKKLSRQETRLALESSERQQREIIDNAHVGIIALNAAGIIRFINPMACQQFGVGRERILGYAIGQLIAGSPGRFDPLQHALDSLGRDDFVPITAFEAAGARADGSQFPMLISIKAVKAQAEMHYLVTVIDITKRKRLEAELQQANDQLEHKVLERTRALEEAQQELVQAEKMAALGRMSSAVVHELNQPLTAMRTYLAICRHLIGGDRAALEENLSLIDDLTQRMALITRQLKTFAFKKPASLVAVHPRDTLDQTLVMFRDRFEQEQIELTIGPFDPELQVLGDHARLEQVFVNLIKNACDAMQEQSTPRRLTISAVADGKVPERVVLSVEDSGHGVDDAHLSQLFDPFFTTKPIGDGLGLGLSIVASIVRDLDGEISVEKSAGGGACFRVILPRFSNPVPESESCVEP